MWPRRSGINGPGAPVVGGPEGVTNLLAGPQAVLPGLGHRRQRVHGAGGEEDVAGGNHRRVVDGIGTVRELLRLSKGPCPHLFLGVGVGAGLALAPPHQDHLVEDLPLRAGEGPAPDVPVVGGEIAGGDGEALLRDDEQQQPAVGQVAGAMREEGVLNALVLFVPIVGRVQKQHPEGVVGYGGGEEVAGQGAVQHVGGLLRPVPVQLHPAGLHGDGAAVAQQAGELGQGVSSPAAGIQDAQRVGAAGAAPGSVEQLGNQVNHPGRRGIEASLWLGQRVSYLSSCSLEWVTWNPWVARCPCQVSRRRRRWTGPTGRVRACRSGSSTG